MYRIITGSAGDAVITCDQCGHVVGIAAMCKKPIEATIQMLTHVAAHYQPDRAAL
jgi:hypothetical protein